MGAPVITASDLVTYLELTSIDSSRATFIIAQAQGLCEAIVNPLPAGASAVVLDVSARAFMNPQQVSNASIGTAHLQFGGGTAASGPLGGLRLLASDKKMLRILAGRGSAFSADTLPTGINAVQTVLLSGATGGTFTLTFSGATTTALAYNATALQVQNALLALPSIGSGNVSVAGGAPSFVVTFISSLGTTPLPPMTCDGSLLVGGTVTVVQTTTGVMAPGQGLPFWDQDNTPRNLLGQQTYGPF
jgi:hypothetical protein